MAGRPAYSGSVSISADKRTQNGTARWGQLALPLISEDQRSNPPQLFRDFCALLCLFVANPKPFPPRMTRMFTDGNRHGSAFPIRSVSVFIRAIRGENSAALRLPAGPNGKHRQISKSVENRPVSLGMVRGLVEGGAQLATAE